MALADFIKKCAASIKRMMGGKAPRVTRVQVTTTSSRPSVKIVVPTVSFLCEQSGPSEALLKEKLKQTFSSGRLIRRAYLVRVTYGNSRETIGVVLALRTSTDHEEPRLVDVVGAAFASIFGAHEHLDILFVRDEQEEGIGKVCPAFYSASEDTGRVH